MDDTLASIQEDHAKLFTDALKDGPALARGCHIPTAEGLILLRKGDPSLSSGSCGKLRDLLVRINTLLKRIYELAGQRTIRYEDYEWLSEAAASWQSFFSSILNLPKSIDLPKRDLLPGLPTAGPLTEEELDKLVRHWSKIYWVFQRENRQGRLSTDQEILADWHHGEMFLMSDILEGRIDFASRIGASSYPRLEKMWLMEVKELIAYLEWEQHGRRTDFQDRVENYESACEHIRRRLMDEQDPEDKRAMVPYKTIKADAAQFGEAKRYLEEHYLNGTSIGDKAMWRSDATKMVKEKISRLSKMSNRMSEQEISDTAEKYVRGYYDHIVAAILSKDSDSTFEVLKAFHYSMIREHSFHLINCFEMALAIYFLDPEVVRMRWYEAAKAAV